METLQLREDFYWTGIVDDQLRVFDIIMYTEFGTTYNSYILKAGDKTILFETAKAKFFDEYLENRGGHHCHTSRMGRARTGKLVGELETLHPIHSLGITDRCQRHQSHRHLLSDARSGVCGQTATHTASGHYLVRFTCGLLRAEGIRGNR